MSGDTERYPLKIQKLFAPKLPFLYKAPVDYAPERRATPIISPLSDFASIRDSYKREYVKPKIEAPIKKQETHAESFSRQLREWENGELFAANEHLKDPHRTVFVARLYYSMTEIELSKLFSRFGSIESIRIARNITSGKSRGYGFIVFEQRADAASCVQELAATGLAVDAPASVKPRKILVDTECGRLVRSWKPMRLGGGLGGRHYTTPSAHHSKDASSAASGRRMNLPSNPYQSHSDRTKRSYSDRYSSSYPNKRPAHNDYSSGRGTLSSYTSYSQTPSNHSTASARASDHSIKDKYAKYSSSASTSNDSGSRSIRSIRRD